MRGKRALHDPADCYTEFGMTGARQILNPFRLAMCALCTMMLWAALYAQDAKAPVIPPAELVRAAVANEVAANNAPVKSIFEDTAVLVSPKTASAAVALLRRSRIN